MKSQEGCKLKATKVKDRGHTAGLVKDLQPVGIRPLHETAKGKGSW